MYRSGNPNQGYPALGIRATTPLSARDGAAITEPKMSRVDQTCNSGRSDFESSSWEQVSWSLLQIQTLGCCTHIWCTSPLKTISRLHKPFLLLWMDVAPLEAQVFTHFVSPTPTSFSFFRARLLVHAHTSPAIHLWDSQWAPVAFLMGPRYSSNF